MPAHKERVCGAVRHVSNSHFQTGTMRMPSSVIRSSPHVMTVQSSTSVTFLPHRSHFSAEPFALTCASASAAERLVVLVDEQDDTAVFSARRIRLPVNPDIPVRDVRQKQVELVGNVVPAAPACEDSGAGSPERTQRVCRHTPLRPSRQGGP